jgi:hypothetical protein
MDKKESSSWLKRTWGKIKGWNWQKIGGFGGLLGGLGAVVAVIFLSLNLFALRKQIEFENRGFLGIRISAINTDSISNELIVDYRFERASRTPPLFKQGIFWKSLFMEYDIVKLIKEHTPQSRLTVERVELITLDATYQINMTYDLTMQTIDREVMSRPPGKIPGVVAPFYIHSIFKYEDVMGKNYWVYMRWHVFRTYVESKEPGVLRFTHSWEPEEYIWWRGVRDEKVPSRLPKELRELSRQAREKRK